MIAIFILYILEIYRKVDSILRLSI